jgi:hypothetical protein
MQTCSEENGELLVLKRTHDNKQRHDIALATDDLASASASKNDNQA